MIKDNKPFNPYPSFAKFFKAILRYPDLTPSDKMVWARLVQFGGDSGVAFPKQTKLAKEVCLSADRVGRILTKLERVGFIEIKHPVGKERWQHRANRYCFVKHPIFYDDYVADDEPLEPLPATSLINTNVLIGRESVNKDARWRGASENSFSSNGKITKTERKRPTKEEIRNNAKSTKTAYVSPFTRLATLFYDGINPATKTNRTQAAISHGKALRYIHEKMEVPLDRLEKVVQWYATEFAKGTSGLPVARSTSMFRTKFESIEAAMLAATPKPPSPKHLDDARRAVRDMREQNSRIKPPTAENLSHLLGEVAKFERAVSPRLTKFFRDSLYSPATRYVTWIRQQVVEWDKWNGGLDDFYPPKKHYMNWISGECRDAQGEPMFRKDREVLLGAK